jgi:hypothetical protein
VLVLSRQKAIGLLRTVLAAPITSSVHGAPSEVPVGVKDGLKHESVINLDRVQTVDQTNLHHFVGTVGLAPILLRYLPNPFRGEVYPIWQAPRDIERETDTGSVQEHDRLKLARALPKEIFLKII